jgi:cobalamin synthase
LPSASVESDWPKDLGLPLVGSVLLSGIVLAHELPWADRAHPAITLLFLVLGSWRGLVVLGYVADALGNPADPMIRARILNDRFIGSFGVCAIALSVLIQLAAVISIDSLTFTLAASPIAAMALGLFGDVSTSGQGALHKSAALIGLITVAVAIAAAGGSPIAATAAAVIAPITAWRIGDLRRHDSPISRTVAGHLALLTLLVLGHVK